MLLFYTSVCQKQVRGRAHTSLCPTVANTLRPHNVPCRMDTHPRRALRQCATVRCSAIKTLSTVLIIKRCIFAYTCTLTVVQSN